MPKNLNVRIDRADIIVWTMYIIISLITIRKIIFFSDILFVSEVGISPFSSLEINNNIWLYTWNQNDLGYPIMRNTGVHLRLLQLLAGYLSINGKWIVLTTIFINIFLSGVFFYYFLRILTLERMPSFIGGLTYMLSAELFQNIAFSHITTYMFAYSIFPLLLLIFIKSFRDKKIYYLVIASLLSLITSSNIHMFIFTIISPTLILYFCELGNGKKKVYWITVFIFLIFILNSYWIIPTIFNYNNAESYVENLAFDIDRIKYLSAYPIQSIIGMGWAHKDYLEIIGTEMIGSLWYISSYILLIILFFPLLNQDTKFRKYILFCSLFMLSISVWMSGLKSNSIFEHLLSIVYENSQIITIFREPVRLKFLYVINYSLLMAISADHIYKISKRPLFIHLIIIFFIFMSSISFLSGDFGGIYKDMKYDNYNEVVNYFSNDINDYRVLFLPPDNHVRYSPNDEIWSKYPYLWSRDPIMEFFPKPSINMHPSFGNTQSNILTIYIFNLINNAKLEDASEILGSIGVKYIIVRSDIEFPINKFSKNKINMRNIKDSLTNSKDFTMIKNISDDIYVFSVDTYKEKIFIPNKIIMTNNEKISVLTSQKESSIFLKDVDVSLSKYIDIINVKGGSLDDFVYYHNTSIKLKRNESSKEEFKLYTNNIWISFPEFAELATTSLRIGNNCKCKEEYLYNIEEPMEYYIFLRLLKNPLSDTIRVAIDGNIVQDIYLESPKIAVETMNIRNIHLNRGEHNITIQNVEGVNGIFNVGIISKDDFEALQKYIMDYVKGKDIIYDINSFEDMNQINTKMEQYDGKYYTVLLDKGLNKEQYLNIEEKESINLINNQDKLFINYVDYSDNLTFDNFNGTKFVFGKIYSNKWLILKSKDIAVKENNFYYFKTHISSMNATNLHMKLFFFDHNHSAVAVKPEGYTERDAIYLKNKKGENWNNTERYVDTIFLTPKDVEYLRLSYWFGPNLSNDGELIVSDLVLENADKYSYNNSFIYNNVSIYYSGNYFFAIDMYNKDNSEGIIVTIDNNKSEIHKINGTSDQKVMIGPYYLDSGVHTFKIIPMGKRAYIRDISLYGDKKYDDNEKGYISSYNKNNPTLYNVKINSTQPFMLAFAEKYDPLWIVKVNRIDEKQNGEIISSIPLFSFMNGFWIDKTGNLDITIEYQPQKVYYIGMAMSSMAVIILILFVIFKKSSDDKTEKDK